ncbi:MAG: ATP-binding cassette domain-containing protein [Phycisphaerae bacterium]|nr:ATP-binding cassette domain-containing protein [Phycisphaerae bacterium]
MTATITPRIASMIRPASASGAAIVLTKVDKHFGNTHAVRSLDLVVPHGSICGFLGPNGAGKSTSIRMIMSIFYPDSGEVRVLGGSALENKDKIGYLPEERGLYRTMRVAEFLAYLGRLKGLTASAASKRALAWLDRIALPGVAKKRCQELSKGMQQKVQFIAAVLHEPDLLILDEPFSGLDPVNARLMMRLIDELHQEGRTIIFSTHQMHTAEKLCDRVVLINRGQKLLDATLDEVRTAFDPRTLAVEPLRTEVAGGQFDRHVTSLPGVMGVERDDERENTWLVHVDRNSDPQPVIAAIAASVPLRAIALKQVSLEKVFVDIVEASGETAPPLHGDSTTLTEQG